VLEQHHLRVGAGEAGQPRGSEGPDAGVHLHHVGGAAAAAPRQVRAGRRAAGVGVAVGEGQDQEGRSRRGVRQRLCRAEEQRRRRRGWSTEENRRRWRR